MSAEQLWLVAAIVLFILEIITPGFVLANFAIAAIGAAIAAWFGGNEIIQVIVFSVICLLSFVTVRPILGRTLGQAKGAPTGLDALVGREALVTESIPGGIETGRVQVDGDSWRAISNSRESIDEGALIRIVKVDSTTLIVEQS